MSSVRTTYSSLKRLRGLRPLTSEEGGCKYVVLLIEEIGDLFSLSVSPLLLNPLVAGLCCAVLVEQSQGGHKSGASLNTCV